MPSEVTKLTVKIHLDIDIDGAPVTVLLEMPATFEGMSKSQPGLTIHLHLDGRKLATAIMPHLTDTVRHASGTRNF